MNAIIVFALFIAGAQAGYLHAPALYAAAPVAVASPVLTHTYPTYSVHSPAVAHIGSTYAAPAVYAPPAIFPAAAPIVKTLHAAPIFAGAFHHHYAAPAYGFALKK